MIQNNNIPQGYKKTEIGIIPQEWEVKRLVDLCQNTGDYGINAPAVPYREDLPTYLRITDIDGWGKFIETDKVSVDNPNSSQFILREGDIVFARTGATVGKTYLYNSKDGQLIFAGFLIRFTPNSNKAIPYYIKASTETASYWNWVRIISQRSGQPGINSVEYGAMKLAVPPLAEQRKIAKILGVWDEAIEKQSRLIEKLELRKRALMQRLLTGCTRLPGFTTPWQKVKLGEIEKISSAGVDKKVNKGEVPVRLLNFVDVFYRYFIYNDELTHWVAAKPIKVEQCSVQKGDIFFTPSSEMPTDIAISAVAMEDMKGVVYSYHIVRLRPHIEMDLHYRAYAFKTDEFYKQAERICDGSGQRYVISQDGFRNMSIHLPYLPEQKAIAEVLTTADKEIATHRKKLDALRLQKRGLMQQLLTGKTRVKI